MALFGQKNQFFTISCMMSRILQTNFEIRDAFIKMHHCAAEHLLCFRIHFNCQKWLWHAILPLGFQICNACSQIQGGFFYPLRMCVRAVDVSVYEWAKIVTWFFFYVVCFEGHLNRSNARSTFQMTQNHPPQPFF